MHLILDTSGTDKISAVRRAVTPAPPPLPSPFHAAPGSIKGKA